LEEEVLEGFPVLAVEESNPTSLFVQTPEDGFVLLCEDRDV